VVGREDLKKKGSKGAWWIGREVPQDSGIGAGGEAKQKVKVLCLMLSVKKNVVIKINKRGERCIRSRVQSRLEWSQKDVRHSAPKNNLGMY